ncbi:MAG: PEP-CTERM sorting domain-containing protein [Gemmatimonadota bacterium]
MRTLPFVSALGIALLAAPAQAQSRPLYVTDGYDSQIFTIQGGAVTSQFTPATIQAFGLAVSSDIRTLGSANGYSGQGYTFGGTPTGAPVPNTTGLCCFFDGTTDGTYNYASSYYGGIWRANTDWSGLAPFISTSIPGNLVGITYDSGTNSLWVGQYGNGSYNNSIFQYAMNGTLLSSFTPNVVGNGISALAYDYVDETLWFSNNDPSATLFQYSRSGTELGSVNVTGTNGGQLFAAEFQLEPSAVPEPASVVLLATGLLGIAGIAARRRKA